MSKSMSKSKLLPKGLVEARAGRQGNSTSVQPSTDLFELHGDLANAWFLDGPADYMDARGIDVWHAILDGSDQVFDEIVLQQRASPFASASWRRAVLTRLRQDYAHWHEVGHIVDAWHGSSHGGRVTYPSSEPSHEPTQLALEVERD